MICVWPRVKSAEPCVRGLTADLAGDRADLRLGAAVGAPLLDRDLLADEVLVDRLGGLLDVVLRERVACAALLTRAIRERKLDRLDDPLVEQVLLRRLQLLRVLLGLGERAQLALELLAHRRLGGGRALLLEDQLRATSAPAARAATSASVEFIVSGPHSRSRISSTIAPASARPRSWMRCQISWPYLLRELVGDGRSSHLALPAFARSSSCASQILTISRVRELERLEELRLGHLVRAGLDHRQALLRADDDQVELALLLDSGERRVDDELAVDQADRGRRRSGRGTASARPSARPRRR